MNDDRIDTALASLRQTLADLSLLASIATELRGTSNRTLELLISELMRVRGVMDDTIAVLANR
jgi:hypothetical protein